ncbi:MAG TPA: nickel-responsive transcriptional regulator NikR [Polyangiaceae bacterium]
MSSDLNRFGVAMDRTLLEQFDRVVRERQSTRSAVLSDLARAEVVRSKVTKPVQAVGTLTIIYDHHVRDLTERLTEMQHELGDKVHSTMHVHLEHDRCLEVIVLRGRADVLRSAADRVIATRGVLHGVLELFADPRSEPTGTERGGLLQPVPASRRHGHMHPHPHPPAAAPNRRKTRPSR